MENCSRTSSYLPATLLTDEVRNVLGVLIFACQFYIARNAGVEEQRSKNKIA